MTEDSAVKVCVRVRPLIDREENAASEDIQPLQLYWKADSKSVHQVDVGTSVKSFSFDRVFTADETTDQLYQAIAKPLVVSSVEGYNGTIFAYGQTSSGKTFTMMGSDRTLGVIPLAVEDVFHTIKNCPKKEFLLRVSYMEIYNETVSDLLVDSWKPLEIRETLDKNVFVHDLTEKHVTSPAQALGWIRKGEKNRHYGKTKMNQSSSRSHTIFRMILESRERSESENAVGAVIVSHLNLVDLAGSERASQTGAEGAHFKEGCNINRSLFTLGQVIKKLTDESQKGFTNYRDSKLTRILQNSLGGNAKTVIICTITPATFEETLSTLQFASTAKKMKNDPHVTEVLDDGALLKRYRDEIVNLKRRLLEVSSVTQTTETEKEVLSQLLQEKEQLQREQSYRIKNLTKLLVTNSNAVPRMPKRRVTWGGGLLKLATETAYHSASDISLTQKRNVTCIEQDEDFYTQWEIPDEPPEDIDTSQACITIRSFGDSPKDFVSPDRMRELTGKLSSLEHQLEIETRERSDAKTKIKTLHDRVAELEHQLQTEAHQKQEASKKMDDLEKQLQEPAQSEEVDQMSRELSGSIQMCETLASEKAIVVAECDYLKQELGIFLDQIKTLERENAALSQELDEKKETVEFQNLEEQVRKDNEDELHNEISSLKNTIESSEMKCQDLQNKLEATSEALKKKTDFIEELQNMIGKDLVQEVAMLQRSLDDAEGLSRDTKKEWAFLRSQNIALEEKNVTLSRDHKKMENEVNSLRYQVEMEKSRYKDMQRDLQKELNIAFEENTKLTTLLEGKVPKNLIDCVELERTVTILNKELSECQEANKELKVKVKELQEHPAKVIKQLEKSECQQVLLTTELHEIQQLRKDLEEKLTYSEASRQMQEVIGKEREEQLNQLTKKLQSVQAEMEALLLDRAVVQTSTDEMIQSLTAERNHLKLTLEASETQSLLHSLQEQLEEQRQKLSIEEEVHLRRVAELEQQMGSALQEPERIRQEKEANMSAAQSSAEEMEKLLLAVGSLTEERAQLKMDLKENIDMMIEVQDELRITRAKNNKLKEVITKLEAEQAARMCNPASDTGPQLKELQAQNGALREELKRVQADGERLLSEQTANSQSSTEEMDKLLCSVNTLTEDREQLQQALDAVRQEKQHLQQQQDNRVDMLQAEIAQLNASLLTVSEEKSHLEKDLQNNMDMASKSQELLKSVQEELCEQNRINSDLSLEVSSLSQQLQSLKEKLQRVQADGERLLSEQTANSQSSTEEMDKLLCSVNTLTEDREQLQQALDAVRQEKQHLQQQQDQTMEKVEQLKKQLESLKDNETEAQRSQQLLSKANQTISDLREQLNCPRKEKLLSSLLEDSSLLLEKSLKRFQSFEDKCSPCTSGLDSGNMMAKISPAYELSVGPVPKSTMDAYHAVNQLYRQPMLDLENNFKHLQKCSQRFRCLFEELIQKDLAIFEERRLQDVLQCRIQAPSYSIKDEDFVSIWKPRLDELLENRQFYLQKMDVILEKLFANLVFYTSVLPAEISARKKFRERREEVFSSCTGDISMFDALLASEHEDRTAMHKDRYRIYKGLTDERCGLLEDLIQQEAQAQSELGHETIKTYTLLQGLNGAPLKTELSQLQDNQLLVQLHNAQDKLKILIVEKEKLQKAHVEANNRESSYKEATQLLQTELQDSRALVEQKETTIQALTSKLQHLEAEKTSMPCSVELEKLQSKVSRMEVTLISTSDKHKQEIQKLTSLLEGKESSLRRLKETLRSKLQGEESYLEGEVLHARLVQPKGLLQSSVVLEKSRLEEEVRQLKLRITELESLVSSLQAEVSKWKHRAIKMKNKTESNPPQPSASSSKRELPLGFESSPPKRHLSDPKLLDSPRKILDSPKMSLLNSPKSRFFDGGSSSELLARNCPEQFFDKPCLGTPPGGSSDTKQEWSQWPLSPKEEEMCKNQ